MSKSTFDAELVERRQTDGEKCATCGYRVTFQYKLEPEAIWNCGDCFTDWLAQEEATVTIDG